MPTPAPGESHDEFLSRCIVRVLEDGAAESQDQAVAICESIWEDSMSGKSIDRLLARVRQRGSQKSALCPSLVTADAYVRQVADVPELAQVLGVGAKDALDRSRDVLTYYNPDSRVETSALIKGKDAGAPEGLLPEGVSLPPNTKMVFRHVVTTPRQDRDGDVLETGGAKLDPRAPLLWQHIPAMPIGKVLTTVEHTDDVLRVVSALLDLNDITEDAAKLIEADALRFSHGFIPLEWEELKGSGGSSEDEWPSFRVTSFEIIEVSLVSVPSNVDAEVELWSRGALKSPLFRAHAKQLREATKKAVARGAALPAAESAGDSVSADSGDGPGRPGRSKPGTTKDVFVGRSKSFSPLLEYRQPATVVYDWIARWCGCEVKDLGMVRTGAAPARAGAFLLGEDAQREAGGFSVVDQRNLTDGGRECPVESSEIGYSLGESKTWMTGGLQFLENEHGDRLVVERQVGWNGRLFVVAYSAGIVTAESYISGAAKWARENNPARGQVMTLSGEFLPRSAVSVGDLYLTRENMRAVQSAIKMVNERGADMPPRGMIFCGPAGTGKTMSGKAMMNSCRDATFIWVSARDLLKTGGADGICCAFDLAAELAPSIVFFEDVDGWMLPRSVDLLKTEMDGIAERRGILTILTTNYPEQLPAELIDRPGRFHDVCAFNLPNAKQREHMLEAWLGESTKELVEATKGLSGAHMYELCCYARMLVECEDEVETLKQGAMAALEKIQEQRKILSESQQVRPMFGSRSATAEHTKAAARPKGAKRAVPYRSTPVSDADSWDADAAVARLREWAGVDADDPSDAAWAKYAQGFARVTGNGDKFGDYSLPHHDVDGEELVLNRRGLAAAMAAVNGARGSEIEWESDSERQAVYRHLARHYEEDLDEEAPELRDKHVVGTTKGGRALSKKNEAEIRSAVDDIEAALSRDGLDRSVVALLERAKAALERVLASASGDDSDDGKSSAPTELEIKDHLAALLSADDEVLEVAGEAIASLLRQRGWSRLAAELAGA